MNKHTIKQPCLLCKGDMWVAPGQIAYYHGGCRKKGREVLGSIVTIIGKQKEKKREQEQTQVDTTPEVKRGFFGRIWDFIRRIFNATNT